MITQDSIFFGFVLSLLGYLIGLWLNKKSKLINPLLVSIIFVIGVLSVFKIDFQSYKKGADYLSYFLTPCTVCLAVPLYRQFSLLKKNIAAIFIGIATGVITALLCVWGMSALLGLSHELYATLLPKSITTAIGMDVAAQLGGVPEIAVAVIVITGILGNIIGEPLLKLCKITNPAAQGLALGTSAHAIGTSKALEMGEIQGAMSSLSITVAGLLTVVIAPLFSKLI